MQQIQIQDKSDTDHSYIYSDSEYKEILLSKIQGLAEAFNQLKNVINKNKDCENDK